MSTASTDDQRARLSTHAIPRQRGDASPLAPYAATLEHCVRIRNKIDQLGIVFEESMTQLLVCAARDHRVGELTLDDLADLYLKVKTLGPGFTKLWNQHMDVPAGAVVAHMRARQIYAPNGPGGHSWCGKYPYDPDASRPRSGAAVVYVLYARDNEPIYVGSTGDFPARMRNHRGKDFTWWMAYPCESREAAYLLEDGLLAARKLRLNVKAGR